MHSFLISHSSLHCTWNIRVKIGEHDIHFVNFRYILGDLKHKHGDWQFTHLCDTLFFYAEPYFFFNQSC